MLFHYRHGAERRRIGQVRGRFRSPQPCVHPDRQPLCGGSVRAERIVITDRRTVSFGELNPRVLVRMDQDVPYEFVR